MFFDCKVKNLAAAQSALDGLCDFLIGKAISAETVFDSRLVACELLSNVLKHAQGESGIQSRIKDGFVEMKVLSTHMFEIPKTIVCSDVYCESGRGLYLVNELCEGNIFSEKDGMRVLIRIKK